MQEVKLDWYGNISVGNVLQYAWQGGKRECQADWYCKSVSNVLNSQYGKNVINRDNN